MQTRRKGSYNPLFNFHFFFLSFFSHCYSVANRPELTTKEILAKLFVIWQHEKLLPFTTTKTTVALQNPPPTDTEDMKDDDVDEISSQQSQNNRLRMSNFIFNNVISSRFMVTMEARDEKCFEVYGDFLVELIRHKFITMEHVNELSIGLYKHEWNKVCLCKNLDSFGGWMRERVLVDFSTTHFLKNLKFKWEKTFHKDLILFLFNSSSLTQCYRLLLLSFRLHSIKSLSSFSELKAFCPHRTKVQNRICSWNSLLTLRVKWRTYEEFEIYGFFITKINLNCSIKNIFIPPEYD